MKELLVPVGNMDSLIVAIKSGADAVYLGGKKFGARAYANNFNDEEMINAIKLCHLYGVKIYVTVNTLVYESELDEVYEYVKFLHINGVDAVIVQDIGLISMLRRRLPNLEIHASTQVHNTNKKELDYLKSLGVKRVVLARELSLSEIDNIDTPLEKEVFIHGALCVSYSGECLFSKIQMNRSGNRGECAQLCRLPYKLMKDDKIVDTKGDYLLSPKELNTAEYFLDIMNSSIYSLKIEGRMKSPEYVGCVTKLYKSMMEEYYKFKTTTVNEELLNDLKVIFNREYTKGFLFNATNQELMNIKTSNHLGTPLGKVINITKKYISIKLDDNLNQGDGIRFINTNEGMICNYLYDEKTNLISGAKKGEIVLIDNKFNVKVNDLVNKTLDKQVIKKYTEIDYPKISIDFNFIAIKNNDITLEVICMEDKITITSKKPEHAINNPTTKGQVLKQLSKLGNTPFILNKCNIEIDDDIFINIKDLNELRREAVSKLTELRENKKKDVVILGDKKEINNKYFNKINISILARNEEQIKACISNNVDRIYVENFKLFNKYKDNKNIIFRTKRVKNNYNDYALITELSALKNKGIGDYYLNVTNHETMNEFYKYLDIITLSIELDNNEITNIMNYYNNKANVEVLVYFYPEVMLLKYCPIELNVNKDIKCSACFNHKYYLIDRFNKKFPLLTDKDIHITHILNDKCINKFASVSLYKKLGINNFRIELLEENEYEINNLINELRNNLK